MRPGASPAPWRAGAGRVARSIASLQGPRRDCAHHAARAIVLPMGINAEARPEARVRESQSAIPVPEIGSRLRRAQEFARPAFNHNQRLGVPGMEPVPPPSPPSRPTSDQREIFEARFARLQTGYNGHRTAVKPITPACLALKGGHCKGDDKWQHSTSLGSGSSQDVIRNSWMRTETLNGVCRG